MCAKRQGKSCNGGAITVGKMCITQHFTKKCMDSTTWTS